MELGEFFKLGMYQRPQGERYVVHLSLDDQTALCGRTLDEYECIGTTDSANAHMLNFSFSSSSTWLYRHCQSCLRMLSKKEEQS